MKAYLVSLTYNWSAGREYHCTVPVTANDEKEALETAIEKLKEKKGSGFTVNDHTVFQDGMYKS